MFNTLIPATLRSYKKFSFLWLLIPIPFASSVCKFHPTCGDYACMAVDKYGVLFGLLKTVKRVIRCNPLSSGGVDLP